MATFESDDASMPEDWNDGLAWERYHRTLVSQNGWDIDTGSLPVEELPNIAQDLRDRECRSVWVPGCGLSPLAFLLSQLGLEVTASDISPSAIEFQKQAAAKFGDLTSELGQLNTSGSLSAVLHDFRKPFHREAFDLVINVKAIQAFPTRELTAIAGVHAAALRPGRFAYFDTMNVQGEQRDRLEQGLEEGGFVVPFRAVNQWYRHRLEETGIPYLFIFGQPMIPRTGDYEYGGPKWDSDMAKLREVAAEYQSRLSSVREAENLWDKPDCKVAEVIYSTG